MRSRNGRLTKLRRVLTWLEQVLPRLRLFQTLLLVCSTWLFVPLGSDYSYNALPYYIKILFGMVYGIYRANNFHPISNPGYLAWLRSTPWKPAMKLPFGQAGLVWQDVVMLSAVAFLGLGWSPAGLLFIPVCFCLAWSFPHMVRFFTHGPRAIGYTIACGYGIVIICFKDFREWILLSVLLVTVVTSFGILRLNLQYPWQQTSNPYIKLPLPFETVELAGRANPNGIQWISALMTAATLGWLTFCIRHALIEWNIYIWYVIVVMISVIAFFSRLNKYLGKTSAPLTLLARLMTGRFILPRYDYVFLSPILTLTFGLIAVIMAGTRDFPPVLTGFAVTGILLLALLPGPSISEWQLTSLHHRLQFKVYKDSAKPAPAAPVENLDRRSPLLRGSTTYLGRSFSFHSRWLKGTAFKGAIILLIPLLLFGLGSIASSDNAIITAQVYLIVVGPLGLMVYAGYRISTFHPMLVPGYNAWLQRVPWCKGKSLPFGPLWPTWWEVLVVVLYAAGATTLLSITLGTLGYSRAAAILYACVTVYLSCFTYLWSLSNPLRAAGQDDWAIAAWYLWVAGSFFIPNVAALSLFGLLAACTATVGLGKSLRTFPWRDPVQMHSGLQALLPEAASSAHVNPLSNLDWLLRAHEPPSVSLRYRRVLGCGLISLLLGAAMFHIPKAEEEILRLFLYLYGIVTVVALFKRLNVYRRGNSNLISLFGRAFSGHWIIPKYDQILVAPLIIAAAAAFLPWCFSFTTLSIKLWLPLSMLIVLLLVSLMGPSLRAWHYTGGWGRIPQAARHQTSYDEVYDDDETYD